MRRGSRLVVRAENPELSPAPFDMRGRRRAADDYPTMGAFTRLYHIANLSGDEVDILALWLCHNCTENFILVENTVRILAGGSTNPLLSWERRHMDRRVETSVDSHQVKLHYNDITFFELAWINGDRR